jgi:hypothetical protein
MAIPLRSICRWRLDENNFCSAVVIPTGILLVKGAIEGVKLERKLFPNYEAWVDSLPLGGSISCTPYGKQSEVEAPTTPCNTDDYQSIKRVQNICGFRMKVHTNKSFKQQIEELGTTIMDLRESLSNIDLEEDMSNPSIREEMSCDLRFTVKKFNALQAAVQSMSPEDLQKNYIEVSPENPKSFIMARIHGGERFLGVHQGKLVAGGKSASTFKELGIDYENEKPLIYLSKDGKISQLNAEFHMSN